MARRAAGWSIPRDVAAQFPGDGQHLARYARVLDCAEINTSFYRSHAVDTYARWASMTPPGFRFSVKLPRTITHDARLRASREPLQRFLAEVAGLGDRLGALLIQLPPSLAFEPRVANDFLRLLRGSYDGAVACEPRHASWFEAQADRTLAAQRVSRVAADPAPHPQAARPGGWLGEDADGRGALLYYRWHGSPRMYWSRYAPEWLDARAAALAAWPSGAQRWCVFDNTAAGAAIVNALELQASTANTAQHRVRPPDLTGP